MGSNEGDYMKGLESINRIGLRTSITAAEIEYTNFSKDNYGWKKYVDPDIKVIWRDLTLSERFIAAHIASNRAEQSTAK